MSIEARLQVAAAQYLKETDAAYDECSKGIFTLDRIIVGTPSTLTPYARGYLVPALYAYWERFFRIALGEYLRSLSTAQIPVEDLHEKLAVTRLSEEIKLIAEKQKIKFIHELTAGRNCDVVKTLLKGLIKMLETPATFVEPHMWVKTYSNVGFETLEDNCRRFGVNLDAIKAGFSSPSLFVGLNDLVAMRNGIAHGSSFKTLTDEEWEEAKGFVLKVMQELQTELYTALQDRSKVLNIRPVEAGEFEI